MRYCDSPACWQQGTIVCIDCAQLLCENCKDSHPPCTTSPLSLQDYQRAFEADSSALFLTYHAINEATRELTSQTFTRQEFWDFGLKAASVLIRHNIVKGAYFALYSAENSPEDLAFRLGAVMVGAVPVTINWEGDTEDRIVHKITITAAGLVVAAPANVARMQTLLEKLPPSTAVFEAQRLSSEAPCSPSQFSPQCRLSDDRIVIFTSGTTGQPKGVRLSYDAYRTNRATFESFLECEDPSIPVIAVVVNPLHHTNSTSFTDWMMRRPKGQLHLLQKYTTRYWELLAEVAEQFPPNGRIVAPAVSRHFDFLLNLTETGKLPVSQERLSAALGRVDVLIGSAPVGPSTVKLLQRFTNGKLPLVRFGSTETCLQVMGTPRRHSAEERFAIFERGWKHSFNGEPQTGYYIGRAHPPFTEVLVVRSLDPAHPEFLVECKEGEPGLCLTRGGNIMTAYINNPKATRQAFVQGWYANLGDMVFWLSNSEDQGKDYFWQSRDSALLIRGGSNYAYEQIQAELHRFLVAHYKLDPQDVNVAVVGLRVQSEHEDDCCVLIELTEAKQSELEPHKRSIEDTFLAEAAKAVSKGAKPSHVRLANIPRNFKGAMLVPEMKKFWAQELNAKK